MTDCVMLGDPFITDLSHLEHRQLFNVHEDKKLAPYFHKVWYYWWY